LKHYTAFIIHLVHYRHVHVWKEGGAIYPTF